MSRPVAGTYSVAHVRNSEIKQLSPLFFVMIWDIDLIFGMWMYRYMYNDKLRDQIYVSFLSIDFWPSYGPWTLKFGQIFNCHHFFSLWFEIVTWFLVYECIMMSYRSSLHFIPVQWFLAELWPLDFEIWPNI